MNIVYQFRALEQLRVVYVEAAVSTYLGLGAGKMLLLRSMLGKAELLGIRAMEIYDHHLLSPVTSGGIADRSPLACLWGLSQSRREAIRKLQRWDS
jgi:hypothetical protein